MFSRTKLFSASLALGILATAGATGLAQQPQNPSQGQAPGANGQQRPFGRGEGRGFRHGPGPGGAFGHGVLRELNLTDDQKQQAQNIIQQGFESTKAQREELRELGEKRSQGTLSAADEARARTLHEQMRASMKDTEAKIAAILTAEQKAKIEELMKERKANREKFGGRRRGGFPGGPGQNNLPAQKPNP